MEAPRPGREARTAPATGSGRQRRASDMLARLVGIKSVKQMTHLNNNYVNCAAGGLRAGSDGRGERGRMYAWLKS